MKTLVAYFSHAGQNYVNGGVAELEHGNAEVLAGFAAQACGGDLFHIERVEPYPAEYKACVKESMAELKAKARPELARDVDVSGYDRVVVVFPNWCVTMPMPVLMMMTKPNTASLQEPVISTSTIAAKMMPLNSVNTLARTIS